MNLNNNFKIYLLERNLNINPLTFTMIILYYFIYKQNFVSITFKFKL